MCSNNDEMIKFKLITLRSKSETKKRKRWCSDVMLGMGGANGPPSHPRVGEPGGSFWANASPGNLSLAAMGHAGTQNVAEMAASIRRSHTEAMACLSGSGNPSTAQTSNGWERFNGTVAAHSCNKKNCQHRFTVFQKKRNIRATSMQPHTQSKVRSRLWSTFLYNSVPLSSLDLGSSFQPCWGCWTASLDLRFEQAMSFFAFSGASQDGLETWHHPSHQHTWDLLDPAVAPHRWKCVKVPKRKAAARSNPKPVAPSVPLLFALWDFSKLWKLLELLGPSQHLWLLEWPIISFFMRKWIHIRPSNNMWWCMRRSKFPRIVWHDAIHVLLWSLSTKTIITHIQLWSWHELAMIDHATNWRWLSVELQPSFPRVSTSTKRINFRQTAIYWLGKTTVCAFHWISPYLPPGRIPNELIHISSQWILNLLQHVTVPVAVSCQEKNGSKLIGIAQNLDSSHPSMKWNQQDKGIKIVKCICSNLMICMQDCSTLELEGHYPRCWQTFNPKHQYGIQYGECWNVSKAQFGNIATSATT